MGMVSDRINRLKIAFNCMKIKIEFTLYSSLFRVLTQKIID